MLHVINEVPLTNGEMLYSKDLTQRLTEVIILAYVVIYVCINKYRLYCSIQVHVNAFSSKFFWHHFKLGECFRVQKM